MNNLKDRLTHLYERALKYQRYLLGLATFLAFFAIAFRFDHTSVSLIWEARPFVPLLILLLSLFLFVLYSQTNWYQVRKLRRLLEEKQSTSVAQTDLIKTLTKRQKEVYDLILQGKSNKQITTELFIEASTLKTHINQIYKKLNIRTRKELNTLTDNKRT